MGNSIINSAKDLLERVDTTELSRTVQATIRNVAETLDRAGVSQEYIHQVYERLSGVDSESELNEAVNREYAKLSMINIGEEEEKDALGKGSYDESGKGAKSADAVKTKGDAKKTLKDKQKGKTVEHLQALFSGENLTNSFKQKAATIFEAAVNARVEEIQAELVRQSRDVFVEEISATRNSLAGKLDDYLNYVVSEWMDNNELAIDNGIQNEISESFMHGLRNLFENHYIEVPASKVNLLETMTAKNGRLENKLNKIIKENVNLSKKADRATCETVFETMCSGLASTEIEKFKSLARGIEYGSVNEFSAKLHTIKESYFKNKSKPMGTLNEETLTPRVPVADDMNPRMGAYFNAIQGMSDGVENNTQS